MKKRMYQLALALLFTTGLMSCSSSSAVDIDVNDLETACEAVDALNQISIEMMELSGEEGVSEADQELYQKLSDKVEEVDQYAQENFDRSEAEECDNWDSMRERGDNLSL